MVARDPRTEDCTDYIVLSRMNVHTPPRLIPPLLLPLQLERRSCMRLISWHSFFSAQLLRS